MKEGCPNNEIEEVMALSALPENIGEYSGHWVAIRNREVIAASQDFNEVVNSSSFDSATDALYHVPEAGITYYLAA